MKRTAYYITSGAAALCCIFLFSACISTSKTQPDTQQSTPSAAKKGTGDGSDVLKIEAAVEKRETDRYEYTAELPNFPEYPELNALIRKTHDMRFADFDALSTENHNAGSQAGHSFSINWEAVELSNSIISIKISTYQYTGGANGITYIDVINWLPEKNKRITTADLPAYYNLEYTHKQWLEILSRNSRRILENKLNKAKDSFWSELITEGTAPDDKNFQNISISGNEITVWFEKYQVAPGSEGIVSVPILINELK